MPDARGHPSITHDGGMSLAVCVLFDGRGDRAVRGLWERLEAHGVPTLATHTHGRHLPHLSLAVLRRWDVAALTETLGALPDGGPFPVAVHGSLVFPRGRVALAVSIAAEVALRQRAVTRAAQSAGADLHVHYRPGDWVPHVSVATRAVGGHVAIATTAINDLLPLTLWARSSALVDSGTGEVWPLPVIP